MMMGRQAENFERARTLPSVADLHIKWMKFSKKPKFFLSLYLLLCAQHKGQSMHNIFLISFVSS
jgi:hypothetical protein